jgi:23S rRNA pseudouridine2605 synthase
VKRMLVAVGHPVTRLHRSAYAGLTLEGLESAEWRELEPSEVQQLASGVARLPGRSGRSPG